MSTNTSICIPIDTFYFSCQLEVTNATIRESLPILLLNIRSYSIRENFKIPPYRLTWKIKILYPGAHLKVKFKFRALHRVITKCKLACELAQSIDAVRTN